MPATEAFNYHSEQVNATSNKTRRNIVNITNSKGTKRVEEYDSTGALIHNAEKNLTKPQITKIKNNEFIPGLFKDCCGPKVRSVPTELGALKVRSKTRKVNRRRK
jgi:hypothetical protein